MAEIATLRSELEIFAASLSPAKRRRVLQQFVAAVARRTKSDIRLQQAPDGEKWEPRKNPPKHGKGKNMMLRLRRHLKTRVNGDTATVGFAGRAGQIARIHHDGALSPVMPGGPAVRYEIRRLLELTDSDTDTLEDLILQAFAR